MAGPPARASAANRPASAITGQAVAAPPVYAFQFNAGLSRSVGVAVASNGTVYVADAKNKQAEEFSAAGAYLTAFGSAGTGAGQFDHPYGSAVAQGTVAPGGAIYVSDLYNDRVEVFTPPATVVRYVAPTGSDSGDCTVSPCRTIRYGVAQASDGNTVRVAAGTYTETVTSARRYWRRGVGVYRAVAASALLPDGDAGTGQRRVGDYRPAAAWSGPLAQAAPARIGSALQRHLTNVAIGVPYP